MQSLSTRYDQVRTKLVDILKEQKYICITTDVWSSRAQAYLGMTVHYLTSTFERKSFLLAFRSLNEKQTHEVLAAEINKILEEFGLPNYKVTHILTDGGSAFCKAFKRYGNQHDTFVEDIQIEDIITEEPTDVVPSMPYIQNEDGEFFLSNTLYLNLTSNRFDSLDDTDEEENVSPSSISEVEEYDILNEFGHETETT